MAGEGCLGGEGRTMGVIAVKGGSLVLFPIAGDVPVDAGNTGGGNGSFMCGELDALTGGKNDWELVAADRTP